MTQFFYRFITIERVPYNFHIGMYGAFYSCRTKHARPTSLYDWSLLREYKRVRSGHKYFARNRHCLCTNNRVDSMDSKPIRTGQNENKERQNL